MNILSWRTTWAVFGILTILGLLWDGPAGLLDADATYTTFSNLIQSVTGTPIVTSTPTVDDGGTFEINFFTVGINIFRAMVTLFLFDYSYLTQNIFTNLLRIVLALLIGIPILINIGILFSNGVGSLLGGLFR